MSLQGYYLVISFLGWYWWVKGSGQEKRNGRKGMEERTGEKWESRESKSKELPVTQ